MEVNFWDIVGCCTRLLIERFKPEGATLNRGLLVDLVSRRHSEKNVYAEPMTSTLYTRLCMGY